MPAWLPPLITVLVPALLLAGGLLGLHSGTAMVWLIAAVPIGVFLGYLLAGLALRGVAVTAGFYLLLALAVASIFVLPTDFEDAGTLMLWAAIALAVLLTGAAGFAAWDVWRALAARAAGGA